MIRFFLALVVVYLINISCLSPFEPKINEDKKKLEECGYLPMTVPDCVINETSGPGVDELVWEEGISETVDSKQEEDCLLDLDCVEGETEKNGQKVKSCLNNSDFSFEFTSCGDDCFSCRLVCEDEYRECAENVCSTADGISDCLNSRTNCRENCDD